MRVDDASLVSQVSRSPVQSRVLQESAKSLSTQNLTQGQLARWKIAETVRFEVISNSLELLMIDVIVQLTLGLS